MNFHYGENIYLIDFCYFIKKVMFFITRSSSSTLSCQNQTSQKGATLHSPFTLLSTLCAATLPSFSSRFRSATRQQKVAGCNLFSSKTKFLAFRVWAGEFTIPASSLQLAFTKTSASQVSHFSVTQFSSFFPLFFPQMFPAFFFPCFQDQNFYPLSLGYLV